MKKWKLCSGLLAIFISGAVVGYSLGGIHIRRNIEHMFGGDHPRPQKLIVEKLTRELRLTGEQREFVEGVVCRTHKELAKLRQRHHPEIETLISSGVAEIKGRLDSGQQEKFDALYERTRKRWGKWRAHSEEECK